MAVRLTIIVFLTAFALALLAAPLASEAQAERPYRIGFLGPAAEAVYTHPLLRLRTGLRELGYAEGKSIVFEYKFAENKHERLPGLASELIRSKVDIIVVHASTATRAVKQATSIIPIVMVGVGDPEGTGFVASLARPGGNITGVSNIDAVLDAKRLQLLKELLPKLVRLAVLRNPANPASQLQFRETQTAAQSLGIETQLFDVRDPKELESAFTAIAKARGDALIVLTDPLFLSQQKQIVNLVVKKRLPSVFGRDELVDAGGLMSYGANLPDQFRQAATYVDKILKGAKPADLPVQRATKFELVINLKAARALGLTIPQSVLMQADRVID
jgi:putative tryptophan/tyrosine transport system substrate-binding protein